MYGVNIGTLNVYQGSNLIWNQSGNQGNKWYLVEIILQANSFSSSKVSRNPTKLLPYSSVLFTVFQDIYAF